MIITELYDTIIKCKNTGNIDDEFKITVSLIDYNEEYVTGRNFPVYLINPNGTSSTLHNGIGGQAMDYVITFIPTMQGVYTVVCNHTKKQFYIEGLKRTIVDNKFIIYASEKKVILVINGNFNTSKGNWVHIGTIPSELAPDYPILFDGYNKKADYKVSSDGKIWYRNWNDSANTTDLIQTNWSRKI